MKNFLVLLLTFHFSLFTFHLPAAFAQTPTPGATPSSSPANRVRDTLRERVEEKLTKLSNKPRALVGKITDIQDGSILLETKNGIKQLRLGEEVKIVDTRDKKKKTIETKSLVIGDLIVAMGFINTKDVLDARRILVISQVPTTTRRAVYGIVQEIAKDSLTIRHPKKEERWTIKIDSKTRVTAKLDGEVGRAKFSDIQNGHRIAVVGTPTKETNTLLARLIHVIPGVARGLEKASPTPTASPSPSPKP